MFGKLALSSFDKRGFLILLVLLILAGSVFSLTNRSRSKTANGFEASTAPYFASSIPAFNQPTLLFDPLNHSSPPSASDTIRAVSLSPKPLPREAAAGHPLFYTFTVTNLGNVDDQYTLTATGNRWPLTLLSADSALKISSTGIVAAAGLFQFVAKVDVPGNAAIGALDTARIVARSVAAQAVSDFTLISTISLGPSAALPWMETFPQATVNNTRWPYNFGPARADADALNEPSPPFALDLDGASSGGDEIRSQPINLAGKRDAVLQFALQKCSTNSGCRPENGDDFFVDYFNDDGEWINLRVFPGGEPYSPNFSIESITLPADAYHSSFRFRFHNIASQGPFDDWYVDDVNVFEVTPTKIPFVETFPAPTLNAGKWPVSTGVRVDTLGRNEPSLPFSANLTGNSLLQTQPIDLSGETAVSVRYFYQQTGFGEEPDTGDDLLLEFRNAQGNWILLARHLGSTGGLPDFTRHEVPLPPAAYHRDFRLRFRAIGDAGSDDWFVDEVRVDVFSPPEIDVVPIAISTTLFPDDFTTRSFEIRNAGPGELVYRIRYAPPVLGVTSGGTFAANWGSQPAAKYPENYYRAELAKHARDWREGQPVVLRRVGDFGELSRTELTSSRGGPDNFGYIWRDSQETDGPAFKWIDISATGTRITGVQDDDNVGPFNIGFVFPFYDSIFTTFRFCTNGFISFTSTSSRFTNDVIPLFSVPDLVAPFWTDLDLTTGEAYYKTDSQRLIVQWTNAVRADGGPYTFQLILTPEGNIVFQYLKIVDGPTHINTIGIQNHDGSDGLEIAFNTNYARDGLAVRIERPASWLRFRPQLATIGAGAVATVQTSFNATGLAADSTYRTELLVESNDVDEPVIAVQVILEVIKRPGKPDHFDFDTTNVKYIVNIDAATIDGQPLDAGDEIGVFTPAGLTAGAVVWNGSGPARMIAYGDDSSTTDIDGFKPGETMHFRVWDRTRGDRDYPATPTYVQGDGRFGTGDSARVSLLAAQTRFTRQTMLNSGWSWISFNVEPEDRNVASVMAGVSSLAIMSNGEGEFYIPGQINNIGELDVLEGYKVFLNAPDSVRISGQEVLPNTSIPLQETWNFISFLPAVPINGETALASVLDRLVLAKNDEGKFFLPGQINLLGAMLPGRGYRLYMRAPDTLIYPFGEAARAKPGKTPLPLTILSPPKHYAPIEKAGESYSLVIRSAAVNGKSLQSGDEIGVFTPSGRLVGAGVWPKTGILGIAVWQDDQPATRKETARRGFLPGEKMIFRFWRAGGFEGQKTGEEEITASPAFLRGDGTFGSEVYSVLELEANPLPQQYRLHQNFPNPLSPNGRLSNSAATQTLIRYELPKPGFVELRVYNLLGQTVRTLKNALHPAGYHEVAWDGRDEQGRPVAGGVYLYRLQVRSARDEREFVAVRKVVIVP